ARQLSRCVGSILAQKFRGSYEIIIVDDGSTDDTREVGRHLQEIDGRVRYFRQRHAGYASARNVGLKKCLGCHIAFTDDDCVVPANWLSEITSCFGRTGADALGGPVLNPVNHYIAWSFYLLNFSSCFPCGRTRQVCNLPTTNIAYRSDKIKGLRFSESLGEGGYEDSVFNMHFLAKGNTLFFCRKVSLWHYGWSPGDGLRRYFAVQRRSALGFLRGGYPVHGVAGAVLFRARLLNVFCPSLLHLFYRCAEAGFLLRFFYHLPLIFAGEIYRGWMILWLAKEKT
ncbi:MAG: glycosyltransferase, partial [Candidatus Woesearchaeota archaeon]